MSDTSGSMNGHKSPMTKKGHVPSISTATSHLLTATKALLQSLTSWSQQEASVADVSSKYVKFGDTFKTLKRSYSTFGIDVSNLPDIPAKVRLILERSLVLEPSKTSLDTFLPQIGDSVAELMKMLKEKQSEMANIDKTKRIGSVSSVSSSVSSLRQSNSQSNSQPGSQQNSQPPTAATSAYSTMDFGRSSSSKDPITRLQNNTNLMRRASKRFSAYQTSSIISMHSPSTDNKFNTSDLPKTPQMETIPSVTEEDIEKAKNTSNLEHIDETSTKVEDSSNLTTHRNVSLASLKEKEDTLTDTTKSLTGGISQIPSKVEENTTNISKPFGISKESLSSDSSTLKYDKMIFLKLRDEVKKINISLPTTLSNLKILFAQKFNYSPPGISSYPKFYIQDGPTSISYELENISEIQYGCIISLQQPDIQTAIFKHVDTQLATVKNDMMNMEDRILKKIENLSKMQIPSTPVIPSTPHYRKSADIEFEKNMKKKLEKTSNHQKLIDDLQDEITKIKQHQIRSVRKINDMVNVTVNKLDEMEAGGIVPRTVTENAYVKECKTKVSDGCESLVEKLDDLQDVIEFIKKDITKHNIKPSDKQLDHLSKEMNSTKSDLTSLAEYSQMERKNLQAMWNKQMSTIAGDQRFFKAQEEIIGLLEQDYQSAKETFDLIVSCAKQLEKGSLAYKSKLPVPDPTVSPWDASKLVMAEVDAINPNHQERVEAIMKAERVREMEKELRLKDEFQEELGDFVNNDKLKKTEGGIDQIERIRQEKDLEHMKSTLGVI